MRWLLLPLAILVQARATPAARPASPGAPPPAGAEPDAAAAQGGERERAWRRPPRYELRVRPGWRNASRLTVKRVLRSAADELMQYFPEREFRPMVVEYKKEGGPPVVFYAGGRGGRHTIDLIRLTSTGTHWAQYVYQFAHEHCHVLQNAELPYPHEAAWFGESLSELASLFVLRRLSETWKTRPPFRGWEWFAKHLGEYADSVMRGRELPEGKGLAEWYREHREDLRGNALDRPLNAVVACALLPLFEAEPGHWESMSWLHRRRGHLRGKTLTFEEFLAEWHHHCPGRHRGFVARIARAFGFEIGNRSGAVQAVQMRAEPNDSYRQDALLKTARSNGALCRAGPLEAGCLKWASLASWR